MVVSAKRAEDCRSRILARGNFSLDSNGMAMLLLALACTTLFMAVLVSLQGYWPVLVIALTQIVLVSWLLIRVWQNAWVSELIEVDEGNIRITQRRHGKTVKTDLNPAWARVEIEEPDIAWYAPRVYLRSKDQVTELGTFLTAMEKRQLARAVSTAIAPFRAW